MKTDRFEPLAGAVLQSVSAGYSTYHDVGRDRSRDVENYTLTFDRGTLVIENPILLTGVASPPGLMNQILIDPLLTEYELRLVFKSGQALSVSLKPEHFNSPEAAAYTPNYSTSIVVFQ